MVLKSVSHQLKWYVGYTAPRHERLVNDYLESFGVEIYLPLQKELRKWSDRKKEVEMPLFPNYIFVRTRVEDLHSLLQTRGLVRFVKFRDTYATIRDEEIEVIKNVLIDKRYRVQPHALSLRKGQMVNITDGPFKGITGEIHQESGRSNFILRIDSIGQGISVELPREWLKVPAPAS